MSQVISQLGTNLEETETLLAQLHTAAGQIAGGLDTLTGQLKNESTAIPDAGRKLKSSLDGLANAMKTLQTDVTTTETEIKTDVTGYCQHTGQQLEGLSTAAKTTTGQITTTETALQTGMTALQARMTDFQGHYKTAAGVLENALQSTQHDQQTCQTGLEELGHATDGLTKDLQTHKTEAEGKVEAAETHLSGAVASKVKETFTHFTNAEQSDHRPKSLKGLTTATQTVDTHLSDFKDHSVKTAGTLVQHTTTVIQKVAKKTVEDLPGEVKTAVESQVRPAVETVGVTVGNTILSATIGSGITSAMLPEALPCVLVIREALQIINQCLPG